MLLLSNSIPVLISLHLHKVLYQLRCLDFTLSHPLSKCRELNMKESEIVRGKMDYLLNESHSMQICHLSLFRSA